MSLFFFISFPILLRTLLCWLNFGGVQRVNLTFNAISSLSLRSSRLCRSHLMCRIIFAIEFFAVHTSGYSILIQPDLYNLTPLLSYKMKSNEKYLRSFLMFSQKFDLIMFISCLLKIIFEMMIHLFNFSFRICSLNLFSLSTFSCIIAKFWGSTLS